MLSRTATTKRSSSLKQVPALIRELPPLPEVATRVLQVMRDPRSRRPDVARLIIMDPALAGRTLAMANSAYYGLARRITSVDEAIGYIGFEQTKQLIYAASLQQMMTAPLSGYLLERGMLWRHSLGVAMGAHWVAERLRIYPVHNAYMGGLFHDIGKLALNRVVQEQARAQQRPLDEQTRSSLVQFERELTGYDHAEIGAMIAQSWQLPEDLVAAVRFHHDPGQQQPASSLVAAVHIANTVCLNAGVGVANQDYPFIFAEEAIAILQRLGWKEEDQEQLLKHIEQEIKQAEEALLRR
ncbi:MAG: HDOD domain-containing protein [Anaerolineae bacterium]|nr:HDOD domain-containing protein [Anaerolineae bacterium]